MGLALWFRPPRRTLTVFLCLILVLGGALGWLGWRLLKQDRALEGQRLQERLELAADHMAAGRKARTGGQELQARQRTLAVPGGGRAGRKTPLFP